MKRAVFTVLMAAAIPAIAQQAPAEPKKEPEKERRPLNLRLDNPSSFATIAPEEKEQKKDLPTLGDDARKVTPQRGISTGGRPDSGGPYPKDTNPMQ